MDKMYSEDRPSNHADSRVSDVETGFDISTVEDSQKVALIVQPANRRGKMTLLGKLLAVFGVLLVVGACVAISTYCKVKHNAENSSTTSISNTITGTASAMSIPSTTDVMLAAKAMCNAAIKVMTINTDDDTVNQPENAKEATDDKEETVEDKENENVEEVTNASSTTTDDKKDEEDDSATTNSTSTAVDIAENGEVLTLADLDANETAIEESEGAKWIWEENATICNWKNSLLFAGGFLLTNIVCAMGSTCCFDCSFKRDPQNTENVGVPCWYCCEMCSKTAIWNAFTCNICSFVPCCFTCNACNGCLPCLFCTDDIGVAAKNGEMLVDVQAKSVKSRLRKQGKLTGEREANIDSEVAQTKRQLKHGAAKARREQQ